MKGLTFHSLLNVIGELFSDEISLAVANTKEYVYFRPSKRIDLKIRVGDPVRKGTIAEKALSTGKKASAFIDRDVFGVPYYGMAVPFLHDRRVEGCVIAIYPVVQDGTSVVTIKTEDGWCPIPFDEIFYIEAKDRKTYVHAKDVTGTHKQTLHDFEYFLPRESFVRCHRAFIVNVNHIKEIYPDTHSTFLLHMKNDEKIPVSQSYSSYFRKLLGF